MTEEHAARRRALLEAVSPGIVLVPAPAVALRNNDVDHAFRQGSDLYYLTGYEEPDSCLVLSTEAPEHFQLFVRPKDPTREVWDGARAGLEGAKAEFGADVAHPIAELDAKLPELLFGHERVFTPLGIDPAWDERLFRALPLARRKARRGGHFPLQFIDIAQVLHEQRRIKSPAEVERMRAAARLTTEAHVLAMKATRPGLNERDLEALIFEHCRRGGAARLAYESIVGSGPNATVLHYVKNDRCMEAGELLLIDAGCEYDYYAADVTRTFPVSGTFTPAQAELYDLVLGAQKECIAACRPGFSVSEMQALTVRRLTEGLVRLGFVQGPVDEAIEQARYKPYYMHQVSHYLGMDVHDVGPYFRGTAEVSFEPGVVVTVEPGLYVAAHDTTVPEAYRGIGIRIEDDVLITEDGCEVLTAAAPKERAEIEALVGRSPVRS